MRLVILWRCVDCWGYVESHEKSTVILNYESGGVRRKRSWLAFKELSSQGTFAPGINHNAMKAQNWSAM